MTARSDDTTPYEEPVLPETAYGDEEIATAQRTVISTEERRHLGLKAMDAMRERGVVEDISLVTIFTAIDGTLDALGVKVADEVYAEDASDGTPVCPHCGGRGVEALTEDERQFFAYMAAQRWRTVAEKDTTVRDQKRARWQAVAVWFDPTWKPE